MLKRRVTVTGDESFSRVCKTMGLPFELHNRFSEWLIDCQGFSAEVLGLGSYNKVRNGLTIPYPTGHKWKKVMEAGSRKQRRAAHMDCEPNEDATNSDVEWIQSQISSQNAEVQKGGKYVFNIQRSRETICNNIVARKQGDVQAVKKKRTKAVATGHEPAPRNVKEALYGTEAETWAKSMGAEFNPLVEKGVLDLGYTKADLLKEGIDLDVRPAVPCGTYLELKFDSSGEIDKHKSRVCIQGHPGNMQKGVHFTETFSATPKEHTWRIMCALVVFLGLTRKAFDITKAYYWADLPEGELIALKYPPGFKKVHPDTGEELFIVLRKNLYGHPSAGRTFSKARNKVVMQKFNQDGWTCKRTRSDPCLFVISRAYNGVTKLAWMLVHVDDCDIICETDVLGDEIMGVCASIWDITIISPDFMLGIRRRVHLDQDGRVESVECDMIAFIEGMYEAFKEHMPIKKVNDPAPPKLFLSKGDKTEPGESERVLAAGYQAAVGMLLWAVRHCHPIGKTAVSMMCRVMATPSWRAFNAAMQMIAYLYQNRTEGVKFSANANRIPIGFVDASNKPDMLDDGVAQWGDVFIWMGGPISETSKKLTQVGLSSAHQEYMGMYYANQELCWIRNLMTEMGLGYVIAKPTVLFADNAAANKLSKEDIVTHGNQYVGLSYHYNKEIQEDLIAHVEYVKTDDNLSDLMTKVTELAVRRRLQGPLSGYDTRLIMRMEEQVKEIYLRLFK